jgi:hypothetical protein
VIKLLNTGAQARKMGIAQCTLLVEIDGGLRQIVEQFLTLLEQFVYLRLFAADTQLFVRLTAELTPFLTLSKKSAITWASRGILPCF